MKLHIVSLKLFALPVIFCLGNGAVSQPLYEWVKYYRGEYTSCKFGDLFARHEGGYAMTGYARIANARTEMWLEVVDEDGNELVNKTYFAVDSLAEYFGESIIQTTEGDYVIGGLGDAQDPSSFKFVVTRVDSAGNQIWWGDYADPSGWCKAVIELKMGNIVAAGFKTDAYVIMLNPDGEVIWDREYGDYDGRCIYAAREVEDGLVFAGGTYEREGWLLKTDFEGEPIWSHTYGNDIDFRGMATCPDGGFAAAGVMWSMVRTDDEGGELWSQQFSEERSDYCWGMTRLWSGDFLLVGIDNRIGRVIYVNSQGELQWERSDSNLPHGPSIAYYSAVEDHRYRMVVAGLASRGEAILIKILPERSPPIIIEATPEESELFVIRSDTVTFLVYAEDAQSDTLFYCWYLDDELIDSCATDTSDIVTVTFDELGDHRVSCFVSDGELQDSVFWAVRVKELMVTGYEPQSLTFSLLRDSEVAFHASTRAAPGDPLTLEWTRSEDLISDADTALIGFPDARDYRVRFRATTGEYADSVMWTVSVRDLLITDWEPDSLHLSLRRHTIIPFGISVSAVEPDSVTYRWFWVESDETISLTDTVSVQFEYLGDFILRGQASVGEFDAWQSWQIRVWSVLRGWLPEDLILAPTRDTTVVFMLEPSNPTPDSLRYLWTLDGDSAGGDSAVTLLLTAPARHTVKGYLWDGAEQDSVVWEVYPPEWISDFRFQISDFGLGEPYPNPFNATTVVSYQLSVVSNVSLKLYDINGRLVQTLVDGWRGAGEHRVIIDVNRGTDRNVYPTVLPVLPAGVYFLRLQAGGETFVKKAVVVK